MKKLSLALCVLGTFAASAQAQTNVTVYGIIDLGIAKTSGASSNGTAIVKDGNDVAQERNNHSSRIGFKGSEDLGGGLSAIFQLESQIMADTGALKTSGTLFERQANVGLSGGFGTIKLGQTKGLIDGAAGWPLTDPFNNDGIIGDTTTLVVRAGVSKSRVSNAVTYSSPTMSGVTASAQYVLSENKDLDAGYQFLLTYENGPVTLHAGYERPPQTSAASAPTLVEMNTKPTMYVVGGGYQFGTALVTAAYFDGNPNPGTVTPATIAAGKNKGALIGLNYTVGSGDAKAVYAKLKNDTADIAKVFGVGYDYHLSKRTDLYAYVGHSNLATLANKAVTASVNGYQIGVSHKF